ncbi:MAG: hypothetical protein DRP74_00945 [Candidatus Omnitrophota bacterium]|nr:MAG: hypothetical protein DRP74_00945 [Candidatus Omnitrophota bacterium]
MSEDTKRYSYRKYLLAILETVYLLLILLVFLVSGLSKTLAEQLSMFLKREYFLLPAYILAVSLGFYFLNFPLNFYHSFILEHKFRLSNQNFKNWLFEQLEAAIISYLIALMLVSAFYQILKYYSSIWWLIASLFWIILSLILGKLLPTVIIPIFFKYRKLQDENLRSRLLTLAQKMGIKLLDCFEIDFSKKTVKANAAYVGMGSSKRVILADTLKDKYTNDEIEVIVAHEFAHHKLKHLFKLTFIDSQATLIIFYLIFKTSPFVLKLFDLSSLSDIAALPVILIYFTLFAIIIQPFENYISRYLERSADYLALKVTGKKEAFISMMDKLALQNLADRTPHPLIKFFFFDHPPISERIKFANSLIGQNN